MAITKILARSARMDVCIEYVLNGDKTDDRILTTYHNCTPYNPYLKFKQTKERYGKEDGVQCYHIIQSFQKGEITPELSMEIAQKFCQEYLSGYEAVIGTHIDRDHIHNHICFNSVSYLSGLKYHSSPKSYYSQIRTISDRLCREHGLSVVIHGEKSNSVSYVEWLRAKSGDTTLKQILQADLNMAIASAADYGHFLIQMEHLGYEIKHGKHIAFRPYGYENFIRPGRRNGSYTEDAICSAIEKNMLRIESGAHIAYQKPVYRPYRKKEILRGFEALYVHYLYLLGKIKKQEYPPRMTPQLKMEIMKFERYKAQYSYVREKGIGSVNELFEHKKLAEQKLNTLSKERSILNVKKNRCKRLYDALGDEQILGAAKDLYTSGVTGIEDEFARYMEAKEFLDSNGYSRNELSEEKANIYGKIAEINMEIKRTKKEIKLCDEIMDKIPNMEQQINIVEKNQRERGEENERRRRGI